MWKQLFSRSQHLIETGFFFTEVMFPLKANILPENVLKALSFLGCDSWSLAANLVSVRMLILCWTAVGDVASCRLPYSTDSYFHLLILYLYFITTYQSYKYEKNTAGKSAMLQATSLAAHACFVNMLIFVCRLRIPQQLYNHEHIFFKLLFQNTIELITWEYQTYILISIYLALKVAIFISQLYN